MRTGIRARDGASPRARGRARRRPLTQRSRNGAAGHGGADVL